MIVSKTQADKILAGPGAREMPQAAVSAMNGAVPDDSAGKDAAAGTNETMTPSTIPMRAATIVIIIVFLKPSRNTLYRLSLMKVFMNPCFKLSNNLLPRYTRIGCAIDAAHARHFIFSMLLA